MKKLFLFLIIAACLTACNSGDQSTDNPAFTNCIPVSKDSLSHFEKGVLLSYGWDSTQDYRVDNYFVAQFRPSYDTTGKCYYIQP